MVKCFFYLIWTALLLRWGYKAMMCIEYIYTLAKSFIRCFSTLSFQVARFSFNRSVRARVNEETFSELRCTWCVTGVCVQPRQETDVRWYQRQHRSVKLSAWPQPAVSLHWDTSCGLKSCQLMIGKERGGAELCANSAAVFEIKL